VNNKETHSDDYSTSQSPQVCCRIGLECVGEEKIDAEKITKFTMMGVTGRSSLRLEARLNDQRKPKETEDGTRGPHADGEQASNTNWLRRLPHRRENTPIEIFFNPTSCFHLFAGGEKGNQC